MAIWRPVVGQHFRLSGGPGGGTGAERTSTPRDRLALALTRGHHAHLRDLWRQWWPGPTSQRSPVSGSFLAASMCPMTRSLSLSVTARGTAAITQPGPRVVSRFDSKSIIGWEEARRRRTRWEERTMRTNYRSLPTDRTLDTGAVPDADSGRFRGPPTRAFHGRKRHSKVRQRPSNASFISGANSSEARALM